MMIKKLQKVKDHFKKVDPIIYKAMRDVNFDKWLKRQKPKTSDGSEYFERLCREIIGQQLSGKAVGAIIERFEQLFNNKLIDPHKLVRIHDKTLRNVGMSWSKVQYVKNIAKAYLNNTVQFDKLHKLSDEEITSQLTAIKGVGNWTVEMFLMFTLGREDVFSYGDLGLRKGFAKLYKIDNPTKVEVEKVTDKWKPYRTYGSITLWETADAKVVEANKNLRK
ncbi:DNA-3-methyladenine glycosylase 2 family protein [Candidatus Woesebacteria bacterium]|nr:DNA-3-methyladenine glycosylase 2 family protein [Candidatus Woesebacteria bacterium]